MNKGFMAAGIILVVLGIAFSAMFPSAFYTPAKDVDIDDYDDGEKLTVYGTITDMEYSQLLNATVIELDGNLTVFAAGHIENFAKGDFVYIEIKKVVKGQPLLPVIAYWELVPGGIHKVSETRVYGYLVSLAGVAIVILASVMKR